MMLLRLLYLLVMLQLAAGILWDLRNEKCYFLADVGPCRRFIRVYAFDIFSNRCNTFDYGGCGGNPNRFLSEQQCRKACLVKRKPLVPTVPKRKLPVYDDEYI
ncbi:protease inhibitor carrapatin [Scaptodrosophila lebanonensis]|uniref:Protease inhibitor carrapatin n=1 Tax=Drosophila lebanonensis TaxID=7225 RepID=A0A6J2T2W8_DROLE|nr:protease inhibitor carrapatin [Scaptodrosophila lebanonensis]